LRDPSSPPITLAAAIERLKHETARREEAERMLAQAHAARRGGPDLAERCLAILNVMLLALDRQGRVILINPYGLLPW
jgi:hypothetical protein